MQIDVVPAEGSTSRLKITLSPEEVNAAIDSTYQRLGQRVKIHGFRPGKAPRPLLLRTYGDEAFYHQATDEAIRKWYPKALDQSGVEALDQGELDLDDSHDHVQPGEEFSFTATIPTKPEIVLPEYGEIKIPAPPIIVTQHDVEDVLDKLRLSRATLEPAPAKEADIGDVIKMNVHGRSEGKEVIAQDDLQFELVNEDEDPDEDFPGLSEELAGAVRGDIREISLPLPPDYRNQDLAGKSLNLQIVVKEIQRKVLPPLTDEFVQEVSRAQDVPGLRSLIHHNLEHERTDEAINKVATEVIDSLIARTPFDVPEILVSEEQDRLVREQRRYFERRGLQFDQFLIAVKKSEEQYREELRPAALRNVKRDLLLDAAAKAEEMEPDPVAIDAEVRQMSQVVSRSEADLERLSGSRRLHETVTVDMRRRMALTKLVEMTSGLTPHTHEDNDEHEHESTSETSAEDSQEADSAVTPAE